MYRKLFALSLFFVIGNVCISAKVTPQPGKQLSGQCFCSLSAEVIWGVQTVDVTKENYTRFGSFGSSRRSR